MPIIFGKAPGKIILFGEHAVVYGQPALAIPVSKVSATARIFPNLEGEVGQVRVQAPDIALDASLSELPEADPLAQVVRRTLYLVAPNHLPAFNLQISSTIPIASGMGSSAAISVAVIRALSAFLGSPLSPSEISNLTFEIEKIHHGNPSGIDNNVIAYQKPVFFRRGLPIEHLHIEQPSNWVIADTGERTPTRETVAAVRALHAADPKSIDRVFEQIGDLVIEAQAALIQGELSTLGILMDRNQQLLMELTVSSPGLEVLIEAARNAGACGAKLSGGGRGGSIIALAPPDKLDSISRALNEAGAQKVITTYLSSSEGP